MIQKPMLCATLEPEDIKNLRYPLLATPKLDGIRCLIVSGKAVSRNFKSIPNNHVRKVIELDNKNWKNSLEGFDGEIIVKGKSFNEVSSVIMSEEGYPEFTYAVFDYYTEENLGYAWRMNKLSIIQKPTGFEYIIPVRINNESELFSFETKCLSEGYEGIILRSPNSPYKFGRSTLKEGFLMKLKRFTDGEAVILSVYEKLHNNNFATTDIFGHSKRSSHLAGQIPANTLGGFWVRDLKSSQEFGIGTGLNDTLRKEIWNNKEKYIGKIIKYKSQKSGEKDAPRFPTFLGFRNEIDM